MLSAGPTPHTPLDQWSFKIDGAVQQLIMDEKFENQAAAVNTLTDVSDLVGENNYLRLLPECPSGGSYQFQTTGPAISCDVETHVFPGFTSSRP